MLVELSRREKAAKIKPDPDIDIFMKVKDYYYIMFRCCWTKTPNDTFNIV